MPKISSLLIQNAQYQKSKCSKLLKTLPVLLINCLSEYLKKNTKMGLCISMPSSSSKVNPSSETPDISMSLNLIPPPNSTQTSRELSPAQMSSPTSRRTVITSTGVSFRSMEDLLEEVNRQLMMQQQRP
uniref:C4 protein n=2 Tax=Papaya leaf curl virus TaxID=53260 RepID=A0A1Q2XC77_9GEMI|nr:C4 protein [Papaya leaf curl virus]CVH55515.1 C4 protein [Papaya leaf curl virus]